MDRDTCKFIAHRNNRDCDRKVSPSGGGAFCKRHADTVQAQTYSEKEVGNSRGGKTNNYKKVQIVQNRFGNFEDKETGIVFNKKTRKAEGYQNREDGKVYPLSAHHIVLCKKNYWDYEMADTDQFREQSQLKNDQRSLAEEETLLEEAERKLKNQERRLTQRKAKIKQKMEEQAIKQKREMEESYWNDRDSLIDDDDDNNDNNNHDHNCKTTPTTTTTTT